MQTSSVDIVLTALVVFAVLNLSVIITFVQVLVVDICLHNSEATRRYWTVRRYILLTLVNIPLVSGCGGVHLLDFRSSGFEFFRWLAAFGFLFSTTNLGFAIDEAQEIKTKLLSGMS